MMYVSQVDPHEQVNPDPHEQVNPDPATKTEQVDPAQQDPTKPLARFKHSAPEARQVEEQEKPDPATNTEQVEPGQHVPASPLVKLRHSDPGAIQTAVLSSAVVSSAVVSSAVVGAAGELFAGKAWAVAKSRHIAARYLMLQQYLSTKQCSILILDFIFSDLSSCQIQSPEDDG